MELSGYEGACRQIALQAPRRVAPSLFISNHPKAPAREILTRYHQRNLIESEIGVNVNFFHMDCLSSEVHLNVDQDLLFTLMAHGCYRWLASRLRGCEHLQPKQIYRKFVQTRGQVTLTEQEIQVRLDRRAHNPILQQAQLDKEAPPIPWLAGKKLKLDFA